MAAAIRTLRFLRRNHFPPFRFFFTTTTSTTSFTNDESRYRKQISLANLFQRFGFPSSQIPQFLSQNSFLFHTQLPILENSLSTLFSLRIPQKTLISLIRNNPSILLHSWNNEKSDFFSKLVLSNTSPSSIANLLECSRRFELDPVEASEKIDDALRRLGFSDEVTARILEVFPSVIVVGEREIARVVEFLMEVVGINRDDVVDRVVRLNPRVLGIGVEERLMPLVHELRELGFSGREIRGEIVHQPRVLEMEIGETSRILRLLESLKCREGIKEKIFEEGLLRACYEVKLRVDCLCLHGLIRRDALKVLWKEPRLITYRVEEIEEKIRFLVYRMNYSIECLVDVPEFLGVNFEKQIVPRYNVMEYLRAKSAIGFDVGLKDMVKPSRLRFYNLYVKPYPECEKIYGRFSGEAVGVKKSKHPAGLWKLLKPQKFPKSDEDSKNLRAFMDTLV